MGLTHPGRFHRPLPTLLPSHEEFLSSYSRVSGPSSMLRTAVRSVSCSWESQGSFLLSASVQPRKSLILSEVAGLSESLCVWLWLPFQVISVHPCQSAKVSSHLLDFQELMKLHRGGLWRPTVSSGFPPSAAMNASWLALGEYVDCWVCVSSAQCPVLKCELLVPVSLFLPSSRLLAPGSWHPVPSSVAGHLSAVGSTLHSGG